MTDEMPGAGVPHPKAIGLETLKRVLLEDVAPEEIVALHHEELPEERAREVREFLAADPEWARTLAEAHDPGALEADAGVDDPARIDAAWKDFQTRLAASDPPEMAEPNTGPSAAFVDLAAARSRPEAAASLPSAGRRIQTGRWQWAAIFLIGALLGVMAVYLFPQRLGKQPTDTVRLVELEPERPEAGTLLGSGAPSPHSAADHELLVLRLLPPTALERSGTLPESSNFRLLLGDSVAFRGHADLQEDAYVATVPVRVLVTAEYHIELELGSGSDSGAPVTSEAPVTLRYRLSWQSGSP